jgi:citrate synthase
MSEQTSQGTTSPEVAFQPQIFKGLAGVPVDYTAISKVNPETNSLLYRGYPVQELAASVTFEEVAYLLWNGELPDDTQLAEFEELERSLRGLDHVTKRIVDELPLTAHPMDVVRTAVSVIGASDPATPDDSRESNLEKSIRLFAKLPSIVTYDQRRRHELDFVEPRLDLGYSANFLWQAFGEAPELEVVNAFDTSMILYAEHSFNASTFTARVIASTLSDLYSAITGAIGALKGPLHGGANEQARGSTPRSPRSARSWASATACTSTATRACPRCATPSSGWWSTTTGPTSSSCTPRSSRAWPSGRTSCRTSTTRPARRTT